MTDDSDSDSEAEILIGFRQYIQEDTHTIVLVQPGKSDTRTYSEYDSVRECLEGICHMYEEHFKEQNPECASVTYGILELFKYIDELSDLCCLVYQKSQDAYLPYNKDWIKEKLFIQLNREADKPS